MNFQGTLHLQSSKSGNIMNCIRLLLISAFILCSILPGTVVTAGAQPIDFGVTGGMNISSHLKNFQFTSGDIHLDLEPKITIGYQAGVIARTSITQSLRLQAEPSVILLGARYNESFQVRGFEFQTESRTKLLYIQLPLLLQLTTVPPPKTVFGRPFSSTTFHLTGGIFGGYLFDARFAGTNTGNPTGIPFESNFVNDVTSQYSDYDGGAVLGAGFEHGHSKKIGFETRALFSVFNTGNAPELFFEPRNMAVTFSVYVLL